MTSERTRQRFGQIVLPHLDDALTLARWLTGNISDAQDVTQEACIKALGALDGFRGGSSRAWVLAIVRTTTYTWLRRHRPRFVELADGLAETAAGLWDETENPETLLIAAQSEAQMSDAIAGLPAAMREILVLRDINGLSYREIGEILEIPSGTVMSRLARARAGLMRALKESRA